MHVKFFVTGEWQNLPLKTSKSRLALQQEAGGGLPVSATNPEASFGVTRDNACGTFPIMADRPACTYE
jgi:hypothetical protein